MHKQELKQTMIFATILLFYLYKGSNPKFMHHNCHNAIGVQKELGHDTCFDGVDIVSDDIDRTICMRAFNSGNFRDGCR